MSEMTKFLLLQVGRLVFAFGLISLNVGLTPPDNASQPVNTDLELFLVDGEDYCHPDYCQINNSCSNDTLCVASPFQCNTTECMNSTDFIMCPYLMNCDCLPNWTGAFCNTPCPLACTHGVCTEDQDVTNTSLTVVYCNCRPEWEGKLCDQPIKKPQAGNDDERVHIMAGVLAAALTLSIIVVVVIPIVLWRMRVIFVLKLVYYFKRYEDDGDKMYDVYISMTATESTEKFVKEDLQPKLESLGFSLYIQARDCPLGQPLSETILKALEKSRCTIMLVTPDYVTNEWNRFEYLIAQHETLKLRQSLIPIILEDVDKANMDKALRHILDSVKCLKHPFVKYSAYTSSELAGEPWYCIKDFNNSSLDRISDEDLHKIQKKYEAADEKFWKRLELTLPKKKKVENNGKKRETQSAEEAITKKTELPLQIANLEKEGFKAANKPFVSDVKSLSINLECILEDRNKYQNSGELLFTLNL